MTINIYHVVALEFVGIGQFKRIEKTILAKNAAKAVKIFYRNHPLAKYAKATLQQQIKSDYI